MNDIERQFHEFEEAWNEQRDEFYRLLEQTGNVGLLSIFDVAEDFCWPHSYMPKWAENAENSSIVMGKAMLELRAMMGSNNSND